MQISQAKNCDRWLISAILRGNRWIYMFFDISLKQHDTKREAGAFTRSNQVKGILMEVKML